MGQFRTWFFGKYPLPLVVEPSNPDMSLEEALDLIQKHAPSFRERLLQSGGILFRNFPIRDPDAFVAVLKSLGMGEFCSYVGGDSPRKKVVDGVYTSTEAPPSIKLTLHNELSYVKSYPSHIHFYCDVAPLAKGATIIGDARKIYAAIDPAVKERFEQSKLKYISCYPHKSGFMNFVNKSHKSWINVFETEDKQDVEKKCLDNEIAFEWNKNDWIRISQERPSVISHPQTGEKVWFNQAHHFDFNPKFLGLGRYLGAKLLYCRKHTLLHEVFFADGTPLPRSDLYHIMDVMDRHTVRFPWQKGDVLVLDNILAMHGRESFKGPRRILTAMTA